MGVCCLLKPAMGSKESWSRAMSSGAKKVKLADSNSRAESSYSCGWITSLSVAFREYFETISDMQGVPNHG